MKQLLLSIALLFSITSFAQSLETDRLALIALYNSTNGAGWTNKTGWNVPGTPGDNPCGWYGVNCSDARVTQLNMLSNNLTGTIPPEIGNFTNLKYLRLDQNKISGGIPEEIGTLGLLEGFVLKNNQMSGNLPLQIANLSNLRFIDLGDNHFSGSIPPQLGNLEYLYFLSLAKNNLEGSIPWELGTIGTLKTLNLSNNSLGGNIPNQLGDLNNLTSLNLSHNGLSGAIPTSIGNLTNLEILALSHNRLSGTIPVEIGNLGVLKELDLFNNWFSGNIPDQLGALLDLQTLSLGLNELSGPIPTELGNLTNLNFLNLILNDLSDAIPSQLGNLSKLESLDLYGNQLSGNIPIQLGNLINLRNLDLSGNQLSGHIPSELTALSSIVTLYLNYNNLSGSIPDMTAIPSSSYVDVYNNHFTFEGMESNISKLDYYSPQAKIPIQASNLTLSVNAGGTVANNTYRWFKDGSLVATITGTESYTATQTGKYYVEVTNSIATALTLTSDEYNLTSLPVSLVNFTGKHSNGVNILNWSTTAETDNAGFEILRSDDARTFQEIGFVDGKGESTTLQTYQFADNQPLLKSYYRLKQIDFNGKSVLSQIIHINSENHFLKVYPNPARDAFTIESSETGKPVYVYNLKGTKMAEQPVASSQKISTSNWSSGIYIIKIGDKAEKVVIEK